ncbi:MAG: Phosphohydrolase, partial [Mucilaginibacter sp.]|nr:Phosphohydrolase [Mucilaginibacter sp.]
FEEHAVPGICFHNLEHTSSVVKAVKRISAHTKVLSKELYLLQIAAWFHDIGYLENPRESKQNSAKLARVFLEHEGQPETMVRRVTNLIMATRLNQGPAGTLEEIIIDAYFYYLSKNSFLVKNELLRKEEQFIGQSEINPETWISDTIAFFESHHFFTPYGRKELNPKKEINLAKLKTKLADRKNAALQMDGHPAKKTIKEHPKSEPGSEKGIETLFRIAASNNQRMFTLADNKAHILITVNSIIMSIIVSVLIRKLAESPFLTWPTFILLFTSFLSTVFSILATRPKIDGGTFTDASLELKEVNLIYFGNFHKMTVDEYIKGMEAVIADRVFLYQTLIRDAHWHGSVLGRKYGFLRKAYNVFLFGLIISIAAFVIAFIFHHPSAIIKNPAPTP